jgi:xylulokinase
MVALDASGRVIRPALLWNDTRSADAAAALTAEVGAAEYARRTGVVPVASFTATKLRWLADHEPGNASRVAAVALPHDWLSWRLRGFGPDVPDLDELATDRSDASGTAYFDPVTNQYDRELLARALRIGSAADIVLPRVSEPDGAAPARTGSVAGSGVLAGACVVAAGMGDNAGAALGLGARQRDVVVSIGTSGTVFAVTADAVRDESGTVAGFADASGSFLPLVATLNAARVLDVMAALLDVDHAGLGKLALAAEPGSGGLVLHPYFEGERTPNLPDATATVSGMTLGGTTRPNLARAAVEGLLCGLADGLDAIRALGPEASRILLVGGAAQNEAVATIAGQVFDVPVAVPEPAEYVAMGAAAQAAWALTGEPPDWPVGIAAGPFDDYRAVIREQYAEPSPSRESRPT